MIGRRHIIILILFFSCCHNNIYPQVKDPEIPVIPDISFQNETTESVYRLNVIIQDQNPVSCDGFFLSEIFTGKVSGSDKQSFSIKDIIKINILSWIRYKKGKNYVFYPARYEITFRDNKSIFIENNLPIINRIKVKIGDKYRYLYSYYYDNFKKGRWAGTGIEGFNTHSTRGLKGCVTAIELMR